jgi:hypothetical protein
MPALMIGEIPATSNRKDIYFPINSLVQPTQALATDYFNVNCAELCDIIHLNI